MNILFISAFGDSYGLSARMANDGHDVFYYIKDNKYAKKGQGFDSPKRITHYEPYVDWGYLENSGRPILPDEEDDD